MYRLAIAGRVVCELEMYWIPLLNKSSAKPHNFSLRLIDDSFLWQRQILSAAENAGQMSEKRRDRALELRLHSEKNNNMQAEPISSLCFRIKMLSDEWLTGGRGCYDLHNLLPPTSPWPFYHLISWSCISIKFSIKKISKLIKMWNMSVGGKNLQPASSLIVFAPHVLTLLHSGLTVGGGACQGCQRVSVSGQRGMNSSVSTASWLL